MRRALPRLALLLALAACSAPPPASDKAEVEALRAQVRKLEQEDAAERARQAEEIRAMRQELDGLRAALDAPERSPAPNGPDGEKGGEKGGERGAARKSPRQALKDSLKGMVEGAREAMDRLGRDLDHALVRPRPEKPAPPPEPVNPPATPPAKPGPGTQI